MGVYLDVSPTSVHRMGLHITVFNPRAIRIVRPQQSKKKMPLQNSCICVSIRVGLKLQCLEPGQFIKKELCKSVPLCPEFFPLPLLVFSSLY